MSKKDFQLIADVIREIGFHGVEPDTEADIKTELANVFADQLAATNPRFDYERFLAACGVER